MATTTACNFVWYSHLPFVFRHHHYAVLFFVSLLKRILDAWPAWILILLALTLNLAGFAFANYGWKIGLPFYWLDRHALSYTLFFFLGCLWAKFRLTRSSFSISDPVLLLLLLGQTVAKVGVMSMLFANPFHPWNSQYQLLWLSFSAADMLLFSLATLRWGNGLPVLVRRAIAFVGNHSYTVYLSHPLFLLAGQWVANRLALQDPGLLFFGFFLFTVVGALLCAEFLQRITVLLRSRNTTGTERA